MAEKFWFGRLVLQDVFELRSSFVAPPSGKICGGCQVGWRKAEYYFVVKMVISDTIF